MRRTRTILTSITLFAALATSGLKYAQASSYISYFGGFDSFKLSSTGDHVSRSLNVSFNSDEAEVYFLKLHDMTGNEVKTQQILAKKGENSFVLDVSGMHKGSYFISLQNKDKVLTKRLIIR